MPCSDSEALDYLNDHRTQSMQKDMNALTKRIKELESRDADRLLKACEQDCIRLANKLDRYTALLCEATYLLKKENQLHKYPSLQTFYDDHTEEDVERMKKELDAIVCRKNYGIKAFLKWYNGLNEKEQMLFETRSEFSGYKVNRK